MLINMGKLNLSFSLCNIAKLLMGSTELKQCSMNITNLSETEVAISGENNAYTIDYGVIDSTSITEIELLVDSKSSESFSIKSVSPTCGCTISKFSDTSDNKGKISLRLNLNMINSGRFVKEVPVVYHLGTKPIRETLRLTGFKK